MATGEYPSTLVRSYWTAALCGVLLTGSLAYAHEAQQVEPQTGKAPDRPAAHRSTPRPKPSGYLEANRPFDGTKFLPPFPAAGSAAEAYDIAAWREALKGENSVRWKQAVADDATGLAQGLTQFQCAVGASLNAANAPALMQLLGKVQLDSHWAVDSAKAHFGRPRPFANAPEAPICLNVPTAMRSKVATAYPGGHSTLGMAWGLVMTELAPDRGEQIMRRVRDYSESRLVCGIHYPSDLEAGHTLASGLIARLHAEPQFRADMEVARVEVARARKVTTGAPASCAS